MLRKILFVSLVFSRCVTAVPSFADDVTDSIKEAEKHYQKKYYNEAIKELDFAIQLIRQKRAEEVKKLLPDALPGWKAKEAETVTAGVMFLGGGIKVSREYNRGNEVVTVELAMDNPFLQGILAIIENPIMDGSGATLTRINGKRAIVKFNQNTREGEIDIAIQKKVLITVKGRNLEKKDPLVAFAKRIDMKGIEAIITK